MANEYNLSVGAIQDILEDGRPANPILQIIGYKPMGPDQTSFGQPTEQLRYRIMIGDGVRAHQYCVINNQDLVQDFKLGRIEKWSVVRVLSYQTHDLDVTSDAAKRRIIYITNLEVIEKGTKVGKKLTVDSEARPPAQTHVTQPQPYPMNQDVPPPKDAPPVMREIPAAPMRNDHGCPIISINELTPYIGKWIIKGRVTAKSAVRTYNNARGEGKLFSFTLADKTGEIKVTAFNADCERVISYIEMNKVYILGRAQVKNADKRYTTADFEVTLNQDSLIEEVPDGHDVPTAKFNFVSIASLSDLPPNQPIDLIGALVSISDVTSVMSKTKNKELKKREVVIVDMSRHTIALTLWGESGENFNGSIGDVLVTKAARVGTYGGRSASAGDCVLVNPDLPEARKIKNWYSNLIEHNFTNLTSSQEGSSSGDNWKYLAQLTDLQMMKQCLSAGGQTLFTRCKAMLMSVGRNPVYKCCPTEGCGKKLVDTQSGDMECSKCNQTFTHAKYRFKTDVEIEDQSSSCWVTLWDDKAETLFGMKPDELEAHMRMENKEAYEKAITKPNFRPFIFTLRSKLEVYNDQERIKHTVQSLMPLEPVSYSKQVMKEIQALAN